MSSKVVLLLLLCCVVATVDAVAVWAHLKPHSPLTDSERERLAARLHPDTVQRRRRRSVASDDSPISVLHETLDRSVDEHCVDRLTRLGRDSGLWRVRTVSRWFNAVALVSLHDDDHDDDHDDGGGVVDMMTRRVLEDAGDCVVRVDRVRSLVKRRVDDHHVTDTSDDDDDGASTLETGDPLDDAVDDPFYGKMAGQLAFMGIDALHRRGFNGSGIVIAVLDAGFNYSHSAFDNTRIVDQHDFVGDDNDTQSGFGEKANYHGTAAFSILGASQEGVAVGAAFGASYLLARTENIYIEDRIEEDFFVAGCEWAEGSGAYVLSASLGYKLWYTFDDFNGETPMVSRAAAHPVELGLFVAIANGNEGHSGIGAPADARLVVSVGAVSRSGHRSSFSSMGPTADGRLKPDVVTLGNDIIVASDQGGLRAGSGSSYATPLVAGLAALLMQMHPDWNAQMVQEAIFETASRATAPDAHVGRGLVNATRAASYQPRVSCLPPDSSSSSSSSSSGSDDADARRDYVPFRCFNDGHCDGPTRGSFCQCKHDFYGRDCTWQSAGPSQPGNWTLIVNMTFVGNHDGFLMPGGDLPLGATRPPKEHHHRRPAPGIRSDFLRSNVILTGLAMLCLLFVGLRLFRLFVERAAPVRFDLNTGAGGDAIIKMT
jgi:subtilisin family serine protease